METLIDFVLGHRAGLLYLSLGIGVVLYSCFAKHMTFEGDFPIRPEERRLYLPTRKMRLYEFALRMFPLLYGLYLLLRHG